MKRITSYVVMIVLVNMGSRQSYGEIYEDNFDGEPLSSLIMFQNGATYSLTERPGFLRVTMPNKEAAVTIDLGQKQPKGFCWRVQFEFTGLIEGEELVTEVRYVDLDTQLEFMAADIVLTVTPSAIATGELRDINATVTIYGQDGTELDSRDITFNNVKGSQTFNYTLDLVDGVWIFDFGTEGLSGSSQVVRRILDHPDVGNAYTQAAEKLGATSIKVKTRSNAVVDFDRISLGTVHIPTVTVWGLVVMTLSVLIAGSIVIRKQIDLPIGKVVLN